MVSPLRVTWTSLFNVHMHVHAPVPQPSPFIPEAPPSVSLNPHELSQLPGKEAPLAGVALEEAPPAEAVPAPGQGCGARRDSESEWSLHL